MYTFIVILILIVCVLLALVVLVQNSKGGGLAANFSAPTQVLGARQSGHRRGSDPLLHAFINSINVDLICLLGLLPPG